MLRKIFAQEQQLDTVMGAICPDEIDRGLRDLERKIFPDTNVGRVPMTLGGAFSRVQKLTAELVRVFENSSSGSTLTPRKSIRLFKEASRLNCQIMDQIDELYRTRGLS